MINKVEMFAATCDNCGNSFEDSEGFSSASDELSIKELLMNYGWKIGDGKEGKKDHCYCEECWNYDEHDNFKLKTFM